MSKFAIKSVCLIVYSHYSRDARVRRYAESLARIGYNIDVICLKETYTPTYSNIHIIKYPLERKRAEKWWYAVEYFMFFIYTFICLTYYSLIKKYQVIHINNMPDFLVFCAIIPKLFGAKIVLDMHDPMPELYMSKYHENKHSFIVRLLQWLEKASFMFADKIITANEAFQALFLKRAPFIKNKIAVILNCPDPRIFQRKPKTENERERNFTLFYMGTVEERFGLDIVIDAMPKLISKIPNIRFMIVPKLENEGDYFNKLKIKIDNSLLKNYVKILKPQPLEKIALLGKNSHIGIVLAQNGVFTENILPVKLLEFVQMKIPVIATKTKTVSKYFRDNQLYFLDRNNTKDFIRGVLDIYKNRKLRTDLVNNSQEFLKQHNWRNEEKKYLNLIKSLSFPKV